MDEWNLAVVMPFISNELKKLSNLMKTGSGVEFIKGTNEIRVDDAFDKWNSKMTQSREKED